MFLNVFGERFSVEVVHHQERPSLAGVCEVAVAHADDRGVVELFQDLCFAENVGEAALETVRPQRLDHDTAAGVPIAAQHRNAKSTGPEDALRFEFVQWEWSESLGVQARRMSQC